MGDSTRIPVWLQGLGALAAVSLIGAGLAFSWGQFSSSVQSDHDILVSIRDDVAEIKEDLHQMELRGVEYEFRLRHVESRTGWVGD